MSTPAPPPHRTHDVVVVGAGNGGISAAALLRRKGCPDVVVVDATETHSYKPLQNYVGAGRCTMEELRRPQADVIPHGVHWRRSMVVRVDPAQRTVTCADGSVLGYGDLVLAPGSRVSWDPIPGAAEAVAAGRVCSTFDEHLVDRTWEAIRGLTSGTAVFSIHSDPSSGRETALKPLFMACDHWRRTGVLDDIDVVLVCDTEDVHPVARIDREIRTHLDGYGVALRTAAVVAVEDDGAVVVLEGPEGRERLPVDLLHLLPPYVGQDFVTASGLESPGSLGHLAVDPQTLRHPRHEHVWCIGDGADLGTARTGGALRRQVAVLVENIRRSRRGEPLSHYDGYTVGPIATSLSRLSFGEYDGEDQVVSSVPLVDQVTSRRVWWLVDRYLLPWTYWNRILRGRV